jgi:hypothetical protein
VQDDVVARLGDGGPNVVEFVADELDGLRHARQHLAHEQHILGPAGEIQENVR